MKTTFVTGANRGIGFALAKEALSRGYRVIAGCRQPERAVALHDLVGVQPISAVRFDLLEPSTHEACRREIEHVAGGLDVLIHNAGIYISNPAVGPNEKHHSITLFDPIASRQLIETNAIAPMAVTRALMPLLNRRSSRICFLSSKMGSIGGAAPAEIEYSYSASKAALNMFVRKLAFELHPKGIPVVSLNPGWVATDMGTQAAPLQPEEVATGLWNVIEGLAMSESGSFVDWCNRPVPW